MKQELSYNKQAFTLSEIVILTMVIGSLSAAAIVNYQPAVEKMRSHEGGQILLNILASQKRFSLENGGNYANQLADLDIEFRSSNKFNAPTAASVNPIGSVTRTGAYTLSIAYNDNTHVTDITCADGPAGICAKMGFPKQY